MSRTELPQTFPVDPATLHTVRYVMDPDNFDDDRAHLLDYLAMEDTPDLRDIDVAAIGWHPDEIITALITEVERLRDEMHQRFGI